MFQVFSAIAIMACKVSSLCIEKLPTHLPENRERYKKVGSIYLR